MKSRIFLTVALSVVLATGAACSSGSSDDDETEPTTATSAPEVTESIADTLQEGFNIDASRAECAADILNESLPDETLDAFADGEDPTASGTQGDEISEAIRDAIAECP